MIVTTNSQLREVVSVYSEFDSLAFDVETKGPDRNNPRRNEVFWLSLAGPGRADAIPMGHPLGEVVDWEVALRKDGQPRKGSKPKPIYGKPPGQLSTREVFAALRPIFFSGRRKIGHNVKFDVESTAKYYGETMPPPYDDTALLAYLVDENHTGNRPYGLGAVVKREFNYVYEKSLGRIGVETFPFKQAARYSYHDAKYTWLAFQSLLKQAEREKVLGVYELEAELLECVVDMESTGVPINTEELQKLDKELAAQIKETEERLYEANGGEFNLNADRQVAALLFEKQGHEPRVFTPKQQLPSVAAGALEPFLKDPVVRDFLHWDELKKMHSTYVIGIVNRLHDGRLHADFDQRGARTGRFSCVSGSTLLPTSRGVFRFDEYLPMEGDVVRTHTGASRAVLRKIYKGREPMLRVGLSNGAAIECTREHRVLTPNGWESVGSLSIGSEVWSYVGFSEVCKRSGERTVSSRDVYSRRQTNNDGSGRGASDSVPQCELHRERSPFSREGASGEGAAVLTVEDGGQKPYGGQEWFPAPQLQRGYQQRQGLCNAEGEEEVPLCTPSCLQEGVGGAGVRLLPCPPHRRESVEQRSGQLGSSDGPGPSPITRQAVEVREITPLGSTGVWDIEVEGDHSYMTQGFFNHNSRSPNLQNVPARRSKQIRGLFVAN